MKKILYLHTGAELYGADIVLLTLLNTLDKNKFSPIVVLPQTGPLVEKLKEIGIQVYVMNYPILRRQYFTPIGIAKYIFTYLKSCKKILALVKNQKIDIVHTNTIAVLEGILISRKLGVPLLWHVHEILENPNIVYKATSALMGIFATKIIAVSEAVKKHLVNSGFIKTQKIEVIYNGIDLVYFNPNNNTTDLKKSLGLPQHAFIIGMIGRVNAIKGQGDFIKIVEPLIKKYDNVYALIAGDAFPGQEWRVKELKNTIKKTQLTDRIIYLGYRSDVNLLHCLFDIYVLPSIQADSLPTVILESIASKKVVVGYKCGGICEMVEDRTTGYLETIGNAPALTKDIEELISNLKLYHDMAQRGYNRLKNNYSLELFVSRIGNLYESIY